MTIIDALILGIVEGVTEFLPISSTGHLILTSHLLGLAGEFVKSFEIAIQLGAITAVLVLYGSSRFLSLPILKRLLIAFIPTGIVGLIFYNIVKTYLLENSTVVVFALALGGLAFILFEQTRSGTRPTERYQSFGRASNKGELETMSYKQAALIGLCQSLAIIPGISRSAATIVGGLMLGISRATIIEFSFLLAVPTMLVATGYDLMSNSMLFARSEYGLIAVGFIASFITALVSIRWLLSFIQTHTFTPFGYYRIIIAAIFALMLI